MIYLDHAAAALILPEVKASCEMLLDRYSGNPEAAHRQGYKLRQELEQLQEKLYEAVAPQVVKDCRKCFFADNATALLNALSLILQNPAQTAWASALDHIADNLMLKRTFGKVFAMPLDKSGRISGVPTDAVEADFIMLPHVQSEIGTRQDLAKLIPQLRKAAPRAIILLDMVQSAGLETYPQDAPLADLILISGAKMGAGSGAALLVASSKCKFLAEKFAALRQKDHLIGNTNVVQAAMLTLAAQVAALQRNEQSEKVSAINSFLRSNLENMPLPNGKKLHLTIPAECAAKNIVHIILPGYQSGVLVRMFSAENIMVSAGSACEAESGKPSAILTTLGYSQADAYSGLRVSFSGANTLTDAKIFLQVLKKLLQNY